MKIVLTSEEAARFARWEKNQNVTPFSKARREEIAQNRKEYLSRQSRYLARKAKVEARNDGQVGEQSQPVPIYGSDYMNNFERYRAGFNYEQRKRYNEIMEGRSGRLAEAEAVDVVMREPIPGRCCKRCSEEEIKAVSAPNN